MLPLASFLRAKGARRVLVFLGAGLVWLVALELGCYAYLRLVPSRFNPLAYYLQGMVSNFHPLFHPEGGEPVSKYYPYVGFFQQGLWTKTAPPAAVDPDGWVLVLGQTPDGRDLYAPIEKPKGTIRVVALGGSTMAGMGQSSLVMSIPGQLQTLLQKRYPGKKIEVLNAAFYTYIAAEEMVLLSTKLLVFKPDLIVVMDGYNEFIRAYYLPELPPLWGQFQEFMYKSFKRTQSVTGTLSQLAFLLSKRFYCLAIPRVIRYAHRTHPHPVDAKPSSAAAGAGAATPLDPSPYDRALDDYFLMQKTMIGIAQANHIPILHALQPNISYKKPLSEDERAVLQQWNDNKPRYSEAAGVYFPKVEARYGRFMRSRADGAAPTSEFSRRHIQLLDLNAIFAAHPETIYIDSCHYNDHGATILAQALLPAVERALGLRRPR